MKWINHIAISGAIAAVINPVFVPSAVLGGTAPDWLEYVAKLAGVRVRHRTSTHIFLVWLVALAFFLVLWDFRGIFAAFCLGGLVHVICDATTIHGVPFAPRSDRKFHLFGGRLRTGGGGEYGVAGAVVVACFLIALIIKPQTFGGGWYPFFYDWGGMYREGKVDAKEWKDNRLKFF
jgi:inner membrane protein